MNTRRYMISGIIGLGLLITGCIDTDKTRYLEVIPDDKMVVSDTAIDINGDGIDESVRVKLREGYATDNSCSGNFNIELLDSESNILSSIELNDYDQIQLRKNFEVKFCDYNNDGSMDFNIGYIENEQGNYRFFSIVNNRLERLTFINNSWVPSIYTEHSRIFEFDGTSVLNTYRDLDKYIYEVYEPEDDGFYKLSQDFESEICYTDLDLLKIYDVEKELKQQITADMSDKQILDRGLQSLNWLEDNIDKWELYTHIRKVSSNSADRAMDFIDKHSIKYLNEAIDIENMTLGEFKASIMDKYIDDNKSVPEYRVTVINMKDGYKAIRVYCHHQYFFIVYDSENRFVDSYTWSHREYIERNETYYNKQNAYSVGPVYFDKGTGVFLEGTKLVKLYKGRLIEILGFIENGYIDNSYGGGYDVEFHILDTTYNEDTGDISLVYNVKLSGISDNYNISTQRNVNYKWLEFKQSFDIHSRNIYGFIDNYILDNSIHDDLLRDNYKEIVDIVNSKEVTKIIPLLEQCSKDKNRNELLDKAKKQESEEKE